MTEEEKETFLQKSLSRRSPFGPSPPVIRQRLPLDGDADGEGYDSRGGPTPTSTPSPFPSDELWGAVIGGKRGEDILRREREREELTDESEEEKKKKEYYKMVMNPNRFNNFYVMQGTSTENTTDAGETRMNDTDIDLAEEESTTQASTTTTTTPRTTIATTMTPTPPPSDLGSRLEQAAILKEQQDKLNRKDQQKRAQALREEQDKRLAELQRRQEEDILKRRELSQKRATRDETTKRADAERAARDEQALKELQAAQDSYWTKKLEEERRAKEERMSDEERDILYKEQRRVAEIERAKTLREFELRREKGHKIHEEFTDKDVLKEAKHNMDVAREQAKRTLEQSAARIIASQKSKAGSVSSPAPALSPPAAAAPARLDLREMTRYKAPSSPSSSSPSSSPSQAKPSVRMTVSNTEPPVVEEVQPKKRPIRQQISLDDDDEEEESQPKKPIRMKIFDDADDEDTSPAESASDSFNIPEDEIKKASRWGINLDRLR